MGKARAQQRKGHPSSKEARKKKPKRLTLIPQPKLKAFSIRTLSILPPTEPITAPQLLHIHPVAPNPSYKIYTADNFLTENECKAWIHYSEQCGYTPAFRAASAEYAHRDCGRVSFDDRRVNIALWTRLQHIIKMGVCNKVKDADGREKKAVGVTRKVRIYKYVPGQWFGKHIDVSNVEDEREDSMTGATVLVYLSDTRDGLVGGETVFYDGREVVRCVPLRGRLVVHAHGEECLEHEAKEVTAGVKYIMRSDVVFR